MLRSTPTIRSALPRATRSVQLPRRQIRSQSTSTTSSVANAGSRNSHLGAGVAGGLAGALLFYGIYTFTPAGRTASKINKVAVQAESKYKEAAKKLQENTPSADTAYNAIKEYTYTYVSWIPGGRAYVDIVFKDWDTVRENNKEEADALVSDAYKQFQDMSKSGLSLQKAYDVFADLTKKFADLAGDALSDIVDNHPQLKEKFGGSIDQLKDMGNQYGPEAKKQVDETWKQVKEIVAGGVSVANLEKARSLIEEKVEQVKKLGDEAWKRGLEEAKPILEKNPKAKELIENNVDALKQGNAKEVFERVKSAIESGDLGGLESYIKDTVDKAKSKASSASGGGWSALEKYTQLLPQVSEILPKLQQLRDVADKHKEEGEELFKETVEELKKVLENKSEKASEIAEKAKKEVK